MGITVLLPIFFNSHWLRLCSITYSSYSYKLAISFFLLLWNIWPQQQPDTLSNSMSFRVLNYLSLCVMQVVEKKVLSAFCTPLIILHIFVMLPSDCFLCKQFELFLLLFQKSFCKSFKWFLCDLLKAVSVMWWILLTQQPLPNSKCTIYWVEDPYSAFYVLCLSFCWMFLFFFILTWAQSWAWLLLRLLIWWLSFFYKVW